MICDDRRNDRDEYQATVSPLDPLSLTSDPDAPVNDESFVMRAKVVSPVRLTDTLLATWTLKPPATRP